ncbi:MAG: hypothetical protein LBK77_02320, partial [Spirochaetaceae bacterium]|nr:hypothetical protein [Spirochaetaceae bacterium]
HYILSSIVDRFSVRTEKVCSELITALVKTGNAATAGSGAHSGAAGNSVDGNNGSTGGGYTGGTE